MATQALVREDAAQLLARPDASGSVGLAIVPPATLAQEREEPDDARAVNFVRRVARLAQYPVARVELCCLEAALLGAHVPLLAWAEQQQADRVYVRPALGCEDSRGSHADAARHLRAQSQRQGNPCPSVSGCTRARS